MSNFLLSWKLEFEDGYFRIFDSKKLISGYFDPDYGDLSKIKKHPPHPPKNILEKSIRHMLDVKNYGKIVGT